MVQLCERRFELSCCRAVLSLGLDLEIWKRQGSFNGLRARASDVTCCETANRQLDSTPRLSEHQMRINPANPDACPLASSSYNYSILAPKPYSSYSGPPLH